MKEKYRQMKAVDHSNEIVVSGWQGKVLIDMRFEVKLILD